jgi:large subunit ribosomal protein L20
MPRVKRGKSHVKRRKNLLAKTKGYKWGRKKLIKRAKEAVIHAGQHAYVDRRKKKRVNRGLWQIKIGAAVREYDLSYSKFINLLKKKNIELDRKILAELAAHNKEIFAKLVATIKT